MAEKNKAVEKLAKRVLQGYEAVGNKDYTKAKQLLEPIRSFFHQEDRPNLTFLAYLAIAKIGSKDIEGFLSTYDELEKIAPKNKKEEKLKVREDELFNELMEAMNDSEDR